MIILMPLVLLRTKHGWYSVWDSDPTAWLKPYDLMTQ